MNEPSDYLIPAIAAVVAVISLTVVLKSRRSPRRRSILRDDRENESFLMSELLSSSTYPPERPSRSALQPKDYSIKVVGTGSYQSALSRICGGRSEDGVSFPIESTLILEDSNPYDPQAVRVDVDGLPIGYLARDHARAYRARLAESELSIGPTTVPGLIVGGWDRGRDDRGHFGVRLAIDL